MFICSCIHFMHQITTKNDFTKYVSKPNHLVVIKFGATWCGPCKTMIPILKALSEKYTQVCFLDVDIDRMPELAEEYKVSSVPFFVFLKNQKIVYTTSGAMQGAAFEKLLTKYM